MKILKDIKDRNFVVCSDCRYFESYETIDQQYPIFERGNCLKYNKIVNNVFETNCTEFEYNYHCCDCKSFKTDNIDDEDIDSGYDGICNINKLLCCFDDKSCTMFELKN